MKKSLFLSVLLTFLTTFNVWGQHSFRFHDGKFRIAQFTDIHWNAKSANCKQTSAIIQKVIQTEKPDIAILTGDIVTEQPAAEGWKSIIQIFENSHLPFVVVMGNHDAEVMSKK
ncbi:MAG: metallophosphoesterase, partial [Hoylesella buccalis]